MIDQIVFANNRADLEAATRALDRILLWNHYVVPQWYYNNVRSARWDRFGRPDLMPKYATAAFPTVWWWDAHKAAKLGSQQGPLPLPIFPARYGARLTRPSSGQKPSI